MKLRETENKDWWNTISKVEKKSIKKGIENAKKCNLISHSDVKKHMKNGYQILWTDHALSELKEKTNYFETFSIEKGVRDYLKKSEHTIQISSISPKIFPISKEKSTIRKALVAQRNTLYYTIIKNTVEIVSLF